MLLPILLSCQDRADSATEDALVGDSSPPAAMSDTLLLSLSGPLPCEEPLDQVYSPDRLIPLDQSEEDAYEEHTLQAPTYAAAGVTVADLDGDRVPDLWIARRHDFQLFLNDGQGKLSLHSRYAVEGIPAGSSAADVDGDGDLDLYLSVIQGPDHLLRNEGGWFSLHQLLTDSPESSGATSWCDLDQDGDLDVFVPGYGEDQTYEVGMALTRGETIVGLENRVYLNEGGLLQAAELLPPVEPPAFTFGSAWLPLGGGERWDLMVINDFGAYNVPNQVYRYDGQSWMESAETLGLNTPLFSMGMDARDLNGDQRPDLAITTIGPPVVLLSSEQGWYYEAGLSLGITEDEQRSTGWGVQWHDVEADGDVDLWMGTGPIPIDQELTIKNLERQPDALYLREGDRFAERASDWGLDRDNNTRGGVFADLNEDGFWELIRVPLDGPVEIFEAACTSGSWLEVRLEDQRGDPWGLGARVELEAGGVSQSQWMRGGSQSFLSSGPLALHFGLGEVQSVDALRVYWPDGESAAFEAVEVNQKLLIRRGGE